MVLDDRGESDEDDEYQDEDDEDDDVDEDMGLLSEILRDAETIREVEIEESEDDPLIEIQREGEAESITSAFTAWSNSWFDAYSISNWRTIHPSCSRPHIPTSVQRPWHLN